MWGMRFFPFNPGSSFWQPWQVAILSCLQLFRFFRLLIEQPKGSHMFKMPEMLQLKQARGLKKHLTYMGFWVSGMQRDVTEIHKAR